MRLIQVLSPVQRLAPLPTHQPEKARLAGQFCAFGTFDRDHASAQHPIILVTTIVEKGIDQGVQIGQIAQRQACFGQHHPPFAQCRCEGGLATFIPHPGNTSQCRPTFFQFREFKSHPSQIPSQGWCTRGGLGQRKRATKPCL
ncbi:hypothetical protein D3C87_1535540 [compost metagenome]